MAGISYENLYFHPYQLQHITNLEINKTINQHSVLHISGILKEDTGDEYIFQLGIDTPIELGYVIPGQKQEQIFQGIVTNISVTKEGSVSHLTLEAKSYTCVMDRKKQFRSFQNKSMTSHELVREVLSTYENSDVIFHIPDVPIKQIMVQYDETDWEFLRRFASKYGAGLIPEVKTQTLKLYVGVGENDAGQKIGGGRYTVEKSLEEFEKTKQNDWPEVQELNYVTFLTETEEILSVGRMVDFRNKKLMVLSGEHRLESGLLIHRYRLRQAAGLKQPKQFHSRLAGVSVNGIVAAVSRSTVKVNLKIDKKGRAKYWFPYSTISASPDGSGWYCMPVVGDEVRVYFPTKDEKDAYAISAVSGYMPSEQGGGGGNDLMGDPNVRYLRTVHDKEIQLTEDGITINADSGMAFISLNRDGTINISGEKEINVSADSIVMEGSTVALEAKESIKIESSEGGSIELDMSGNIIFTGSQILSN